MGRWPEFDRAMRHIVPDLPKDAVVVDIDPGDKNSVNVRLIAGVPCGADIVEDTRCERMIAREWLVEFIKTGSVPKS